MTLSVLLGSALGCSGDTPTGPPPIDAANAYWTLQFPYHTVNLALTAPYDTVRLLAIPRNALGQPMANLGRVRNTTSDTAVTVDSTGLITAHAVTAGATVTATLQDPQQRVTYSDIVTIQVTATAPSLPFRTFSMQPLPGDSAKRAVDAGEGGHFLWPVHAVDGVGTTLCDSTGCSLLVSYTSSNSGVATITSGTVQMNDIGRVVLTATTLAYGRVLQDSVVFRVDYPIKPVVVTLFMTLVAGAAVATGFSSRKVLVVGVGTVVAWTSCNLQGTNTKDFDILFDQPAAADTASCKYHSATLGPPTGSGNIAPFGGDTTRGQEEDGTPLYNFSPSNGRCRRFSVPGVYHWHSSLFPADTFTLIVK